MWHQADGEASVLEAFPSATIVRPAPVFGPEDRLLLRFAALIHHGNRLPFPKDQPHRMQPVWVGDVAQGVVNAILNDATKGRVLELAGPEVTTDVELARRVHRVLLEKDCMQYLDETLFRTYVATRQFIPHWRKHWPADLPDQMKTPLVAQPDSGALSLADLGVTPKTLDSCIEVSLKTQEQREIEFEQA